VSPDYQAIREAVAWRRAPELALLSLRGDDARDALLHLCPSRLLLRDAQVEESLLLDADGRPIADVLVCADDEDYLLIVEGLGGDALLAHVEASLPAGCAPEVALEGGRAVLSMHGPWAWDLVSRVLGDDMMALPYLSLFRIDHGICVRAGKTGEFGYDVVMEREALEALVPQVEAAAAALGGREVSAEAVGRCRFENGFFDPAHVPAGVTPLELQLGWRLDWRRDLERDFVGRAAIDARLAAGVTRRRVMLTSDVMLSGAMLSGVLHLGGQVVGEVIRAEDSEALGPIASALLDVRVAHGGVRLDEGATVAAPPLVDNRSLHVDPRRHTFEARDEIVFPPLVRGSEA